MGKHYSIEKAKAEVGKSKSFALARKVSIKKWQEIQKYREEAHYDINEMCGFCFVVSNIGIYNSKYTGASSCPFGEGCPVNKLCNQVVNRKITRPETIIKKVRALKLRKGR